MTDATLDEVYNDRNLLAATFARGYYWHEGWKVLVIDSPAGQLTYHVPPDFDIGRIPEIEPCWDGHSTPEKHERIMAYLRGRA
jgi:hypothetical protein